MSTRLIILDNIVYNNMLERRSVRKYKDTKVSDEDIKLLLEAAMSAPSACNKQPWEFYVVKNEEVAVDHPHWSRREGLFAGRVVENTGPRAGLPAFLPPLCPLDLSLRSLIY